MANKDSENKKKQEIEDDGRTIVDMNVEGFKWHYPTKVKTEKKKDANGKKKRNYDDPTFKEKLALIFGAYKAYLPQYLSLALGFLLAMLLIQLFVSCNT